MNIFEVFVVVNSLIVFGFWGLVGLRNTVISIILSLELLFMGLSLIFILLSFYLDDISYQIFALTILITAAAESTIILSIFVAYQRLQKPLLVSFFNLLGVDKNEE